MPGKKGIVLYSGGLDSLLAAKVLMNQGIEIIGLHCVLPFVPPDFDLSLLKAAQLASQIGLRLDFYRCDTEYIEMLKNPAHGYGKNMNPCIDCKIHFIRKAFAYMRETGAQFVATGEVVGQRPMSQMKHTLNHIINETEAEGRLLRPLSAKILAPTIPEQEGIVDREQLYAINGRSRKRQMDLAKELGIEEFASPGGGCLFTDPHIARRVRDLIDHHPDVSATDLYLLTIGRHFRLSESVKVIVSRNEQENTVLEKYMAFADLYAEPLFKGPSLFIKGQASGEDISLISAISSRYGKPGADENRLLLQKDGETIKELIVAEPVSDDILDKMRI